MPNYEYNQVYVSFRDDGTNHLQHLNKCGNEGWELVTAIKVDEHNVCYIFKRLAWQHERQLLSEEKLSKQPFNELNIKG